MARTIKAGFHRILVLKAASRFATWVCIVAIAILSLVPHMPRTEMGGHSEHVLAYAGTAFIAAIGYSESGMGIILFGLFAYAGTLEFLQRYSPGRTSRFEDFMFSAAGVLVGIVAYVFLEKLLATRPRKSN
jgi:VanZ family protein